MCKYCNDLTIRLECIIWAIAEMVFSVAFVGFVIAQGQYDIHHIIVLVDLGIIIFAGFCLLLGAVLRNRILVLVWIVLIFPAVITAGSMFCLTIKEKWNYISDLDKSRKILGLILILCWISYMVYLSWLLILEIKTGERQTRYPDCVGGHYPRGALRERTSPISQNTTAIAVEIR